MVRRIGRAPRRMIPPLVIVVLTLLFPLTIPPATAFSQNQPAPRDTLWGTTTFWRWSIFDRTVRYQTQALLTKISIRAYWYVENVLIDNGENYTAAQMDAMGAAFDAQVMPRLHAAFGYEPLPPTDIDNDPRITVLIYHDIGVSYFDSRNELPAINDSTSNEREMVYVQYQAQPNRTLSTTAHEVTHLIEWNYRHNTEDWVDEGLAWVGSRVAGFPDDVVLNRFLNDTRTGLAEDRGAAQLFTTYLMEHYGGANLTRSLTQNRENGFSRFESTLRQLGLNRTVAELFRDWIIANIVNAETTDARYHYETVTRRANLTFSVSGFSWSGMIQGLGNGGTAYIGIDNLPRVGFHVHVGTIPASGLSVFLLVRNLSDVRIVEGRHGTENSSLDFEPVSNGTSFVLVISYRDEGASPNSSLNFAIGLDSAHPPEDWIFFLTGTIVVVTALLVFTLYRRRRKKHGRPPERLKDQAGHRC